MKQISEYVLDEVIDKFGSIVVNTRKRIREKEFFDEFILAYPKELESGQENNRLDYLFAEIIKSEAASDMLFEVYRKVCLSASKTIGPKILGMLSSKILFEIRDATKIEELIFDVAETLNDFELRGILQKFRSIDWLDSSYKFGRLPHDFISVTESGKKQVVKGDLPVQRIGDSYEIELDSQTVSLLDSDEEEVTAPSIEIYLGRWAIKLRNLDILREVTIESSSVESGMDSYPETSRRNLIRINANFVNQIIPLIDRATGPES